VLKKEDQDLVPPMQEEGQRRRRRQDVDLNLPVTQIAKKFGLNSTYDTLEGHQKLNREDLMRLFEYSPSLAKDQGGCRLL